MIGQFRRQLMKCGDLSTADKILAAAYYKFKPKHPNPWLIFYRAVQVAKPLVQLKTIRVGRSSVAMPVVIHERQQPMMAIRWLVQEARTRSDKAAMVDKLVAELSDAALYTRGGAVQRKIRLHQLATRNLGNIRTKFKPDGQFSNRRG